MSRKGPSPEEVERAKRIFDPALSDSNDILEAHRILVAALEAAEERAAEDRRQYRLARAVRNSIITPLKAKLWDLSAKVRGLEQQRTSLNDDLRMERYRKQEQQTRAEEAESRLLGEQADHALTKQALYSARRHLAAHDEKEERFCGYKKLIDAEAALSKARQDLADAQARCEALAKELDAYKRALLPFDA